MPKFLVNTTGTVRYQAELVVEAPSEAEAEELALSIMPSISKETCQDEDDLEDVEVNEVYLLEEVEELPYLRHMIHQSAKVGDKTFFVISWNQHHGKEFRVCSTILNRIYPDGYLLEQTKFNNLDEAHGHFEQLVQRATEAEKEKVATTKKKR